MAEKRKITIHPSFPSQTTPVEEVESLEKVVENTDERAIKPKRSCLFCQSKSKPTYTDLATLRKFLTDRAKILPKLKSSVCARHQRAVAKEIKYARHLALLPFVPKV